ncbi:hypothetical protein DZC52_01450 [Wenzhouxiangella sediminis]|uniref:CBM-cenC domain-containing protein n=1 Tax=Wenzhouxiangella sediminis TaxID=1792836 RepID=A0A3E1KCE4_9GAMM|nr:hypothetical protein DZC52_01450 [Wenzhouxiangella sediminis]
MYSRIEWALHEESSELRRNLAAAVSVQPGNREVRWQAANLAQSTGDADLVLDQVALWLADEPRETARALFVAGRWADDPGTLLDRVVPDDEAFLAEAMEYAYRSHDVALAQAVWQRLEQPRDPGDDAFADYVATALNNRRPDLAMQAWQQVDTGYQPGDIPAGDFGVPLEAMPTFGWNLSMRDGVTVERVEIGGQKTEGGKLRTEDSELATSPLTPPNQKTKEPKNQNTREAQALRITFNGEENAHLATPFVRFPMPEPGRYVLTGWWRAEGLTTRSLPYLQLYAESSDNAFNDTVEVPEQNFTWHRFEIPFEVTEANEIFRFRFRRNRTDDFDRYIDGSVWIGGLGIEEVDRTGEELVDDF